MKHRLTIFSIVFIMFIILTACGSKGSEPTSNTEEEVDEGVVEATGDKESDDGKANGLGDFEIELGGEIIEEDGQFIIEGTSNLIPGSRLVGEVIVSEDDVFSDTTELVQDDGSFYMELDHPEYGEAELVVRFDFNNAQDDPVKRHYGERGQNLEGPFIYKHEFLNDIYKKAEVRVAYDPQNKNELVLAAPDWHELPEDYGDPRIWIEIDEITEDGEFYYLEGRSNILEGAQIRGSFAGNRDKTEIMPDGSFDLKIEYKYKEGEDFKIEFNPQYQWNEIEEAYGSEGQKLVGNLVVTNEYSGKQTIEKIIPWDGNSGEDAKGSEKEDSEEEETE